MLAPDTAEGLRQRVEAISAAERLGLNVLSSDRTYPCGGADVLHEVAGVVDSEPDVVVLPNLAPEDASAIIKAARHLGFRGVLVTEAA